jgi:Family of unknown function (DUF6152)
MTRLPIMMLPLSLVLASAAGAHHSVTANFDSSRQVEIRGVVVDFKLRSPHSSFVVDGVAYEDGEPLSDANQRWEIESSAAPGLRQRGIDEATFRPGDRIVVVGSPHRNSTLTRANAGTFIAADGTKFTQANGKEFVFHPQLREFLGLAAAESIAIDAVGVMRVNGRWQPPFQQEGTRSALPLNDAGLAAWEAYDQTQSPANTCEPMSIPVVFNAPSYFVDVRLTEDQAVVRNQAYDIVRTIPLTGDSAPADPDERFGIVSGRVDGDVLVIDSSGFPPSKWGLGAATQINGGGADVPSSEQKTVTEWLSVSDDGQTLTYRYTLFDPMYMREPHTASIDLARVPDDVPMYPYDCDPSSASMFSRAPGETLVPGGDVQLR